MRRIDFVDLVDHFTDHAPPDERVQARTRNARALVDTKPGRACGSKRVRRCRLLGDPHLPNGVSDESARIEARSNPGGHCPPRLADVHQAPC